MRISTLFLICSLRCLLSFALPCPTASTDDGDSSSASSSNHNISSPCSPSSIPTAEPATVSSVEEFPKLTDDFFNWKVRDFPEYAFSIGINDERTEKLDRLNPEHFEQRKLKCEEFLLRANSLNKTLFTEDDTLNFKIFVQELETYLQNFEYLKFFAPINFMNGPQVSLKRMLQESVFDNKEDYAKLLSRYSGFPQQINELIKIMKGNINDNLMPSNWSLAGVSDQISLLLVPFQESVFYDPFWDININITNEERLHLKQQGQRAVEDILSSLEQIKNFLETEYLPATRPEDGVWSLPGGIDYYKACLKFHTSTDMTPEQIHNLGLSEVARIQEEKTQTASHLGYPNNTLSEISRLVKEDRGQKFSSEDDLLSSYKDIVYNVLYPLMDRIVNQVPNVNISVEENYSNSGYAAYLVASRDGSRPGTFLINTKLYEHQIELTAISLHEAIPGHHLQFTTLLSNPSIPDFRKFPDYSRFEDIPAKFPVHTAYVEGWGLYAEFLGEELGLYQDPYQRLGRHSFELLRASRLVVDTGIHAFNWTRQQAINYLLENTAMSEEAIKIQVDRYITWPGQACSYKVGEIKIKELRQATVEALGKSFNLQDFHEVVLGCVGPLNVLEECVHAYIKAKASEYVSPKHENFSRFVEVDAKSNTLTEDNSTAGGGSLHVYIYVLTICIFILII